MSQLFTDNFPGADANPALGNYTTLSGVGGNVKIVSHTLKPSNTFAVSIGYAAYVNSVTPPADQNCRATFTTVTAGIDMGAICRCSTSAATFYLLQSTPNGGSNNINLVKWVGGSFIGTIGSAATHAHSSGDIYELEVTGTGATVTLVGRINGTQAVTGTDSASDRIVAAGRFGIYFGVNTSGDDATCSLLQGYDLSVGNTNYSPGVGSGAYGGGTLLMNPQLGSPGSDTATVGNWTPSTGATLFGCIDETIRADADYIQSGGNPSSDACIVKLATLTDPGIDTGFHLQWSAGATTTTGTIVGSLRQGNAPGSEIAAWTHSGLPVGSYAEFDDVITAAQAANITDFTDLYLKFVAS